MKDKTDPSESASRMTLVNLPHIPELPSCLTGNAQLELETQRLIEAELCLRAATRHNEMAKWAHLNAAVQLAEQQISMPFQKLLWADERHTEETQAAILRDDEAESMSYFISEVVGFRKDRRHPCFDAEECERIRQLMAKYAAAIAETREKVSDALCAEDHDFWRVRQHMMAVNAEPISSAE